MMDTNENYLNNTYHILVRETDESHTSEWFGRLVLSTLEDGEICIDLSFDEQPVEIFSAGQG